MSDCGRTVFLFLFLDIVILALCISFLEIWETRSCRPNIIIDEHSRRDYCVPCPTEATPTPTSADEDFQRETINGKKVCCYERGTKIAQMVKQITEEKCKNESIKVRQLSRFLSSLPKGDYNASVDTKYAHLLGRESKHEQANISLPTLYWGDLEPELSNVLNVQYNNQDGTLKVTSSGYYYIYSQVTFEQTKEDLSDESNTSNRLLCHFMYRHNPSYSSTHKEKLIDSPQSTCRPMSGGGGVFSSYVGAVMSLRYGDEISVKVSDAHLVKPSKYDNYFGIFLI